MGVAVGEGKGVYVAVGWEVAEGDWVEIGVGVAPGAQAASKPRIRNREN